MLLKNGRWAGGTYEVRRDKKSRTYSKTGYCTECIVEFGKDDDIEGYGENTGDAEGCANLFWGHQ